MTLNEKVVNYKILDLIKIYNFGTKFVFIRDHMKIVMIFFCVRPFLGVGDVIIRS